MLHTHEKSFDFMNCRKPASCHRIKPMGREFSYLEVSRKHISALVFLFREPPLAVETTSMSLIKTVTPKLAFDGGKAFWSVDQSLIMDIDGSEYVKLTKTGVQGGFTRLVIENCPTLPAELDKKFSLTWSRGYLELAQLRNAEQRKQYAAEKKTTLRQQSSPKNSARPANGRRIRRT